MTEIRVQIVLPEGANWDDVGDPNTLDGGLRLLTKTLIENGHGNAGYGLGGMWGYGENFENDTFLLHRYCWCEKDNCPWCEGCTCPDSAFHYFVDGQEVSSNEWMAFYDREAPNPTDREDYKDLTEAEKMTLWQMHDRQSEQANQRRTQSHDPVCNFCRVGFSGPGKIAPNFWHKPSGMKVWWYKWIGRSMEVENPNNVQWQEVLNGCLESIQ